MELVSPGGEREQHRGAARPRTKPAKDATLRLESPGEALGFSHRAKHRLSHMLFGQLRSWPRQPFGLHSYLRSLLWQRALAQAYSVRGVLI